MSTPHGFLIVDKPVGVTSFSMVALVRRLTGVRRVGHAGTLDPLASGVLPVAIGQATRLIEYMDDAHKEYTARVRFGVETDTYDAEGTVVAERDASALSEAAVDAALRAFVGEIDQTPPLYSAIKLAGKPLYRYAREGAQVEVAARRVMVESIDLMAFEGDGAEIRVRCGAGTYIRSIAHDLGRALGCGAHLTTLRRTRSGGFSSDDAHPPDALIAAEQAGALADLRLAPDRAAERRPAAIVEAPHALDIACGRDVRFAVEHDAEMCRAYSADGEFLGILRRGAGGGWHPEKVMGAS